VHFFLGYAYYYKKNLRKALDEVGVSEKLSKSDVVKKYQERFAAFIRKQQTTGPIP